MIFSRCVSPTHAPLTSIVFTGGDRNQLCASSLMREGNCKHLLICKQFYVGMGWECGCIMWGWGRLGGDGKGNEDVGNNLSPCSTLICSCITSPGQVNYIPWRVYFHLSLLFRWLVDSLKFCMSSCILSICFSSLAFTLHHMCFGPFLNVF